MSEERAGIGVDAKGGAVIDPTRNVIALNEAANKRQDDLRSAHSRLMESEVAHLREIIELNATHQKERQEMEASRLDSIRQVDVLAVNTASERAAAASATLANQTAALAETLRNTVAESATTLATQSANAIQTITNQLTTAIGAMGERVAALEKSNYEGQGKNAVADPQLAQLIAEMREIARANAVGAGKSTGSQTSWQSIATIVAMVIAALAVYVAATVKPAAPYYQPPAYTAPPIGK